MWYANRTLTVEMLHASIYDRLKREAEQRSLVTYSEIAPLAALSMENPDHREQISEILGMISTYEHQQGRPLLSAVVIHRNDNIPGDGFFELARHLRLMKPGEDKTVFWVRQVALVHRAWSLG